MLELVICDVSGDCKLASLWWFCGLLTNCDVCGWCVAKFCVDFLLFGGSLFRVGFRGFVLGLDLVLLGCLVILLF